MLPSPQATDPTADALDVGWLWSEVGPQLAAILRRAHLPPEDAEDLIHDTFVHLIERRTEIHDPVAWLIGTVRFEVLAYWRVKRARVVDQLEDALASRLEDASRNDVGLRCDLDRCLAELSDRCREVIHQRYTLGVEPVEIAPRIGYTTRGVRKLTRTCLGRLAEHLAKRA